MQNTGETEAHIGIKIPTWSQVLTALPEGWESWSLTPTGPWQGQLPMGLAGQGAARRRSGHELAGRVMAKRLCWQLLGLLLSPTPHARRLPAGSRLVTLQPLPAGRGRPRSGSQECWGLLFSGVRPHLGRRLLGCSHDGMAAKV